MGNKVLWVLYCIIFCTEVNQAQVEVIASRSLSLTVNDSQVTFPYYASEDLEAKNEAIEKVIIVVHGTNRNADVYYDNMKEALDRRPEQKEKTAVIAPQFLTEEDIDKFNLGDEYIYWSSDGWKVGANSRDESSNPRDFRIPSYSILDSMILKAVESFPNLKHLIFTGHSAGGQLTNRYTASSPIFDILCSDFNVASKSIIANPGSYVYMSPRRALVGSMHQFEVPEDCDEYNHYSYGLEDLYTYHREAGADQMKEWYARREVVYMMGEEDNDPDASTLPRSCRAMLQGSHRLERSQIYYNHIIDTFGESIKDFHKLHVIPGVGHDNYGMYHSDIGLAELFDNLPIQSCGETTTATQELLHTELIISPNPLSETLLLTIGDQEEILEYVITDMSGLIIKRGQNYNLSGISTSDLRPGSYVVMVKTIKGLRRGLFVVM